MHRTQCAVHWFTLERESERDKESERGILMIEAVIYDFHGTLADVREVLPLVVEKRYDEFYEASLSCPPIESVVLAARHSHQAGYANLLLTGMPDIYRDGLQEWLLRHDVPVSLTLMRTVSDGHKKDFVVKRRMYGNLLDLGYRAMKAWEDSPAVIDLWKAQGVPVEVMPRIMLPTGVDKPLAAS